ncbi:RDD family protein [Pseudoalteromonas luteoviolacea]|nr:RDD family protein [Pseudoalteromonas luteoviolacea]
MTSEINNESVSQNYLGFWARFGASFIDSIMLLLITIPLIYSIYGGDYWTSREIILGPAELLINYVLPIAAIILFWLYKSTTPGKMVYKAKIVDAKTGRALSARQSIIRYIAYYVSLLPFGLGFFWVAWDPKKQGWHDKLAGTVVVREPNNEI